MALAEEMRRATSKGPLRPAVLMLEDGTVLEGAGCGAEGAAFGELCFNTSLEGYLEVVTDPSYAGQIVVMTYPQIGNYGVNPDDAQSAHPALRGLVVGDMCRRPSNWRSTGSLPDFLAAEGVVAIEGIDTRALVRHLREHGAMKAAIACGSFDTADLAARLAAEPPLQGRNLAAGVSGARQRPYRLQQDSRSFALAQPAAPRYRVAAYDCGVKDSILAGLARSGCEVTALPWDTPAAEVLALDPDGVFLSNGPGDPDAVADTYRQVQELLGKVPVFGICLGHQMICKAAGARMVKLKYGHHGGNHPVMNLLTGRVEITAQNHGFNLDFSSLGPLIPELSGGAADHSEDLRRWVREGIAPAVANERFGIIRLTHVNLNDGTAEGIAFEDLPAFSVQYHPEASPGPNDAGYLFTAFTRLMDGRKDFLALDIAEDRLAGWRF